MRKPNRLADLLADLASPRDLAISSYSHFGRPVVMKVLSDPEAPGGFLFYASDGRGVPAKQTFTTIEELATIVRPRPDDDPSFWDAAENLLQRFGAWLGQTEG